MKHELLYVWDGSRSQISCKHGRFICFYFLFNHENEATGSCWTALFLVLIMWQWTSSVSWSEVDQDLPECIRSTVREQLLLFSLSGQSLRPPRPLASGVPSASLLSEVRGQINPLDSARGPRGSCHVWPRLQRHCRHAHTCPHRHTLLLLLQVSSQQRHILHHGSAAHNKVLQENLTGIFLFVPELSVNAPTEGTLVWEKPPTTETHRQRHQKHCRRLSSSNKRPSESSLPRWPLRAFVFVPSQTSRMCETTVPPLLKINSVQ